MSAAINIMKPGVNDSTAWAMASGKIILIWSVRVTRKEVIRDVERAYDYSWLALKRKGHSVVRIKLVVQ